MTKQQFFDVLTTWLFAQNGNRSIKNNSFTCAYRSTHDNFASTMCAIGLWLSDEAARECDSYCTTSVSNGLIRGKLPNEIRQLGEIFLKRAQQTHDNAYSNRYVTLKAFAEDYELSVNTLNAIWSKEQDIKDQARLETTPQQYFDAISTWLYAQNGESCGTEHGCSYRSSSNNFASTRCVVGLFLSDEEASRCEGKLVDQFSSYFNPEAINLLCKLQSIHDGNINHKEKLLEVAKDYNLSDIVPTLLFSKESDA